MKIYKIASLLITSLCISAFSLPPKRANENDEKEIIIAMGTDEGKKQGEIGNLAYQYANVHNGKEKLCEIQKYWKEFTNRVQVETPSNSMNILLN